MGMRWELRGVGLESVASLCLPPATTCNQTSDQAWASKKSGRVTLSWPCWPHRGQDGG